MVSFAQFRPEKDHMLQLSIWREALPKLPRGAQFFVIGATRGTEDEKLLAGLKTQVKELNIEDSVTFLENKPRAEIMDLFKQSKVAIHTMKEEHFGISIVEMMAAGLITIAHASAGPK